MKKENWVLIYTNTDLLQVKLAEDVLKQHGIGSHILSKPDSAIPSLGRAELYTLPENEEKAKEILQKHDFH